MAKRKGIAQKNEDVPNLLAEIPDFLKPSIGQKSEDMLSNQMLCGIPEVDLGVEAKMRNIEATEEAKQRLLKERFNQRRKKQADDIVPANISVNFVQHSRWNNYIDPSVQQELTSQFRDLPDVSQPIELAVPSLADPPPALEAERRRLQAEKSTDALVLQRFKNYMRGRRAR
ncbi:unnamed protein product [Schistocephalus solidus]|uniref:Uncharacterized protein n=1 Tax=Schistocephalus solidus TaxID=70667 RepID=A0A3P7CN77_SCHSO|nr:unnamed protein product [Schistocephalus solidus]